MYELDFQSKSGVAEAGFKLRKFVTNSDELRSIAGEHQSYANGTLGTKSSETEGRRKILGIQWDFLQYAFTFNIEDISYYMEDSEPTRRNVVSMNTQFFDPLDVISPVIVQFKMFFQCLFGAGVG